MDKGSKSTGYRFYYYNLSPNSYVKNFIHHIYFVLTPGTASFLVKKHYILQNINACSIHINKILFYIYTILYTLYYLEMYKNISTCLQHLDEEYKNLSEMVLIDWDPSVVYEVKYLAALSLPLFYHHCISHPYNDLYSYYDYDLVSIHGLCLLNCNIY